MARVGDSELDDLLQAIFDRFQYDFRQYAPASMQRRLQTAADRMGCHSLAELNHRLTQQPELFALLLRHLTVQVSEMFRNPAFFRSFREHIAERLRTFPSLRIWIAGCSTGEEAYSFAIALREEGLLERSTIYATDISPEALQKAESGVYALDRVAGFTENYQRSGGRGTFAEYYTAGYGSVVFDRTLRKRMVFADHSLATDHVFAEVQLVSCRNVLIYFDKALQDRALGLFEESLCRLGYLALGSQETLNFSSHASAFRELEGSERWYQRR